MWRILCSRWLLWPVASNSLYLDRNWAIVTPKGSINGKLVWRVLHCKQDTSMARICVNLDFPDGNDNFLVNIRNKGDLKKNSKVSIRLSAPGMKTICCQLPSMSDVTSKSTTDIFVCGKSVRALYQR